MLHGGKSGAGPPGLKGTAAEPGAGGLVLRWESNGVVMCDQGAALSVQDLHPFEEELTCSICYNLFEDPRILSCSHTFCRNCLEGVIQSSRNFSIWRPLRLPLKCPNCRTTVEIPAAGCELLPINFAVKAIVEKYRRDDRVGVTCSEHYGQPLNIYCLLDRKLVCGYCLTVGEHNGHPIDDLQSAYMKEKSTAGKLLEQLTDKHWTDLCLLLEELKEQKSQCEGVVKNDRKAVVHYFKKLSGILEQKKQALLTALDEANAQIFLKYDPLIESLKKMRQEQLDLICLNRVIQKEDSPLIFLEKISDMRQRIKALKEQQLPAVTPVEVYPRVTHLLKDVWSKTEIGQIGKILSPKVKLITRRKSLLKGTRWEGREAKELLQAVNPSVVLLVCIIIVVTGVLFHKAASSAGFQAAPAYLSELLLPVCKDFHSPLQNIVDVLCHKFNRVVEFLGMNFRLSCFNN